MPSRLVECIPNFSDARRPEVVDQIRQAISAVGGVHILDQHSDLDHNRTVISYIGTPEAVEEAAFQAIATAARLINLDQHSGAHPRIGATDVVPFVPISEINMTECVEMARRLGRRVGQELSIPVYLYEEAATRPERRSLADIRAGEYEALAEKLTKAEWAPDFGKAEFVPTWGATVVGARSRRLLSRGRSSRDSSPMRSSSRMSCLLFRSTSSRPSSPKLWTVPSMRALRVLVKVASRTGMWA